MSFAQEMRVLQEKARRTLEEKFEDGVCLIVKNVKERTRNHISIDPDILQFQFPGYGAFTTRQVQEALRRLNLPDYGLIVSLITDKDGRTAWSVVLKALHGPDSE